MFEPRFPAALDSTILSTFGRCNFQAFLEYVCGMRIEHSFDLHVGKAWAHGLEVTRKDFYFNGLSEFEAIRNGIDVLEADYGPDRPDEVKNLPRMIDAFKLYFRVWPLDNENGLVPVENGVECRFKLPLPGLLHPDTGEQLFYAGRYDIKCIEKGNFDPFDAYEDVSGIWLVDDKCNKKPFGNWRADFDLSIQMLGYCNSNLINCPNDHTEGVRVRRCFVGYKELSSDNFHEVPIRWNRETLQDAWVTIQQRAEKLVMAYLTFKSGAYAETEAFPKNFGNACTEYGGCAFRPVCLHNALPEYQEIRWNPLDWG